MAAVKLLQVGQRLGGPPLGEAHLGPGDEQQAQRALAVDVAREFEDRGRLVQPAALEQDVAQRGGQPGDADREAVALGGVECASQVGLGVGQLSEAE